jgi:chromosomal replication initiation ATPase DnaA
MSIHLNRESIEAARQAVQAMTERRNTLTAKQAMEELAPDIRAALDKGYSISEIARVVQQHLPVSQNTIRGYTSGKDGVVVPPSPKTAKPPRKRKAK